MAILSYNIFLSSCKTATLWNHTKLSPPPCYVITSRYEGINLIITYVNIVLLDVRLSSQTVLCACLYIQVTFMMYIFLIFLILVHVQRTCSNKVLNLPTYIKVFQNKNKLFPHTYHIPMYHIIQKKFVLVTLRYQQRSKGHNR